MATKYLHKESESRIRDKNNLKKLKDRPANLIPTCEKNQPTLCTDYTELDIEGNFWKSAADATTGADTLHAAELPEAVGTDQHQASSESSNELALFEVDEEAAARMEALLRAAGQQAVMGTENTRRVTRSQGAEFRWNPKMNDKDGLLIVVQKD